MVEFKREFLNKNDENTTMPKCRVEYYFESPVTVFKDSDSTQSSFAAQIASVKTLCTDNAPFYVMEVGRIKNMVELWFHMLPTVKPFYSVNCNSDPILLRLLSEHPSVGFNCTTTKNLNDVLEVIGCEGTPVLYSNPCLTRSTINQAVSANVNWITFQSEDDLHRLMCYHPEAELILNVCVNPESQDPSALLGCEREEASDLIQMAALVGARLIGIGFNVGSDCSRPEIYAEAIEFCAELVQMVSIMCPNIAISVLNIGGGFGNQGIHGNQMGFKKVCDQINFSLEYFFPLEKYPAMQIFANPGRFFAGSAYSLVTNIIDRRAVDASEITNDEFDAGNEAFLYQINDGFYGSFGCKMTAKCEPTCSPLFTTETDESDSTHVYGNVLGPLGFESEIDVVQTAVRFRPLYVGDWLIWSNMGAYSFNNCESLDEDGQTSPTTRTVFYFSSHDDWDHLVNNTHRRNSWHSATSKEFSNCEEVVGTGTINGGKLSDDEGIGSGSSSAGEEETDSCAKSGKGPDGEEVDILSVFDWPFRE